MPNPRVMILTNRWYESGGVENFIRQLVRETRDSVDYVVVSLITHVEDSLPCEKVGPVIPSGNISGIYSDSGRIIRTLQGQHCDVIHIQASNGSAFYLAHLAEIAGIPKRIVHSHNAGGETDSDAIKKLMGSLSSAVYSRAATDLWACSRNAGEHLFGNRPFTVFMNGIDIAKYAFSKEKRVCLRHELEVGEDSFLLGSIGRISKQKNPLFQVRVFHELKRLLPNARFCMVGSGDMEQEVDGFIDSLSLSDDIIRVKKTSDAASFYSAFDGLLFPPVFEGLSFVGIEAQCSGLPVYGSEALPRELKITDRIAFWSLDESPSAWAERIASSVGSLSIDDRPRYSDVLRDAGFDRKTCFARIAKSYGGARA